MGSLAEVYEDMLSDSGDVDATNKSETEHIEEVIEGDEDSVVLEESIDSRPIVKTQPFFGPDKKYGACPICAAVIVAKSQDTSAICPNCHAELVLS